jgi:hypothetical protein
MKKLLLTSVAALLLATGAAHAEPTTHEWFQDMWNRVGEFKLECVPASDPDGRNSQRVWLDVQWKDAKVIRTDWKGYGDKTTIILPITKVATGSNFEELGRVHSGLSFQLQGAWLVRGDPAAVSWGHEYSYDGGIGGSWHFFCNSV